MLLLHSDKALRAVSCIYMQRTEIPHGAISGNVDIP